jgi:hypothetical protein
MEAARIQAGGQKLRWVHAPRDWAALFQKRQNSQGMVIGDSKRGRGAAAASRLARVRVKKPQIWSSLEAFSGRRPGGVKAYASPDTVSKSGDMHPLGQIHKRRTGCSTSAGILYTGHLVSSRRLYPIKPPAIVRPPHCVPHRFHRSALQVNYQCGTNTLDSFAKCLVK